MQKTIGKLSELKKSGGDKDKGLGLNFELRPPHLYQAAWQTVLSTQSLKKTDYPTILAIAELYEIQRWMSLIEEKILQAMLTPGAFDEKNVDAISDHGVYAVLGLYQIGRTAGRPLRFAR